MWSLPLIKSYFIKAYFSSFSYDSRCYLWITGMTTCTHAMDYNQYKWRRLHFESSELLVWQFASFFRLRMKEKQNFCKSNSFKNMVQTCIEPWNLLVRLLKKCNFFCFVQFCVCAKMVGLYRVYFSPCVPWSDELNKTSCGHVMVWSCDSCVGSGRVNRATVSEGDG